MKKIILLVLLNSFFLNAQEKYVLLEKINNIDIFYKLNKIDESSKTDKYTVDIKFLNTSEKDFYYSGIPKKEKHSLPTHHFIYIKLQNVANIFTADNIRLMGEKTKLSYNGEPIFLLRSGKEYYTNVTFKMSKGDEPKLSIQTLSEIIFKNDLYDFM